MAKPNNKPQKKKRIINMRTVLIVVIFVLYIISAIISTVNDCKPISGKISYQEMVELINEGEVKSIQVTKDSNKVTLVKNDGTLLDAVNPKSDNFIEDLLKLGANVEIKQTTVTDSILSLIATLPLMIVMTLLVVYISSSILGGNTKAFSLLKHKDNNITFDDIQGLSETKKEVQFIVEQMKNWKKLGELGARPCKGALLYGPPGTGKTLMAKAIAKEANVNFISCSGSDFNEVFVGLGAARVRQLWELAMTNSPCIIFIDEIDCLGKRRRGGDGATSELNQTLNCLLQRMDGINTLNGIMVIGATNRKDDLDPALLRPGRFDRHYYIGAPDNKKDRDEIVKIYLDTKKCSDDITLDKASKLLVGLTGAEIESALNEAVYVSLQDGRNGIIKLSDIDEAVMRHYTSGVKKEHTSEWDKKVVAYHEAGHALVSLLNDIPISKVSIVPYSSGMGGVTIRDRDVDESKLKLQSDFEKDLCILLAGKIAEEIIFDEHTQGCCNDIEQATKLVYAMITEYGYNNKTLLNERVLIEEGLKHSLEHSLIEQCNELLNKFDNDTRELIMSNLDKLNKIAEKLLEDKTIVAPTLDMFSA